MSKYTRTALVTGANKGIGYAIVRNLALEYPSSAFNNGPLLIYLTARDQKRGEDAVAALQQDDQLKKAKALASHGGLSTIQYHALDISKPQSIKDAAEFVKKEHPDGIDFVINNAGIALEGFDINVVTQTLHSNYYGTLQATRELLPLVRKGGRLVNVASIAGHLNDKYSPAICQRFAATQSVDDVDRLMQDFTNAVKEGVHRDQGWPNSAYSVSKSGVIGMTRAIASEEEKQGSGVLVNSCCPGWVKTDMTKYQATLTVDEGAKTPVLLALEDLGGTAGQFWTNERITKCPEMGCY